MSIHEPQRVKLKIVDWSQDEGVGVVADTQGIRYNISLKDMGEEFQRADLPIQIGEVVSGIITDFDRVRSIMSDHRVEFNSVGIAPSESDGWDPHKPGVVPGTGRNRIGK